MERIYEDEIHEHSDGICLPNCLELIQVPTVLEGLAAKARYCPSSFVNSIEVVFAAVPPCGSFEVTCNQVNFLRNHNGTKSDKELLGDVFLLCVDVADMYREHCKVLLARLHRAHMSLVHKNVRKTTGFFTNSWRIKIALESYFENMNKKFGREIGWVLICILFCRTRTI